MANHSKQPELLDLTHEEVRGLLRPRVGFEAFTKPLIELYQDKREELQIKSFDPDALLAEVDTYESLLAMEAEAKARLALIQKTRLFHASNIWRAMDARDLRSRAVGGPQRRGRVACDLDLRRVHEERTTQEADLFAPW
jgi:hypothetical protein